ncbi:MAG TPA: hypothetical protein VEJ67_11600 [Candidatus Cybelea sp.]|nr:hypothetical protein [Candidatus Cybelea sp.]
MPQSSAKPRRIRVSGRGRTHNDRVAKAFEVIPGSKRGQGGHSNQYCCAIEKNQNGKYNVRVRARFGDGGPQSWTLPVYFLASSFAAAMKKLGECLQLLQKNEERLRFWGVERSDDPNMPGDLLEGFGLWIDRRRDFPHKRAELAVTRERPLPAGMLAPLRRTLGESILESRAASAGD